jgi:hypothetical protein
VSIADAPASTCSGRRLIEKRGLDVVDHLTGQLLKRPM